MMNAAEDDKPVGVIVPLVPVEPIDPAFYRSKLSIHLETVRAAKLVETESEKS